MSGNHNSASGSGSGSRKNPAGPGSSGVDPSTSDASNQKSTTRPKPRPRSNIRHTGRTEQDVLNSNIHRPNMSLDDYLGNCGSIDLGGRKITNARELQSIPRNDPTASAASMDALDPSVGVGPSGASTSYATAPSGEVPQASSDPISTSVADPSLDIFGIQTSLEDVLPAPDLWGEDWDANSIFDFDLAQEDGLMEPTPDPTSQLPVDSQPTAASSSTESLSVAAEPSASSNALDVAQDIKTEDLHNLDLPAFVPPAEQNFDHAIRTSMSPLARRSGPLFLHQEGVTTGMPGLPGEEDVGNNENGVEATTATAPQNPAPVPAPNATNPQPAQATNASSGAPAAPTTTQSSSNSGASKALVNGFKPSASAAAPVPSGSNAQVAPQVANVPRFGQITQMSFQAATSRNTQTSATAQSSSSAQNSAGQMATPTSVDWERMYAALVNPVSQPLTQSANGGNPALQQAQATISGSYMANGVNPAPQATIPNPQIQPRKAPVNNSSTNSGMTKDVKLELMQATLPSTHSNSSTPRMPPPNVNGQLRQSAPPPQLQQYQVAHWQQAAAARPMAQSTNSGAPTCSPGTSTQSAQPTGTSYQSSVARFNAAQQILREIPPTEQIGALTVLLRAALQRSQQLPDPQPAASGGVNPAPQMVQAGMASNPQTQLQRQASQLHLGPQTNVNYGMLASSQSIVTPPNNQHSLPSNGPQQYEAPQHLQRSGSLPPPGTAAPTTTQSFNGAPNNCLVPQRPDSTDSQSQYPVVRVWSPLPAPHGSFHYVPLNHPHLVVPTQGHIPQQRVVAAPNNYAPRRPSQLSNNAMAGPSVPRASPQVQQQAVTPHSGMRVPNGVPQQVPVRQGSVQNSSFVPGVQGMVKNQQAPGVTPTMAPNAGNFQQGRQVRQLPRNTNGYPRASDSNQLLDHRSEEDSWSAVQQQAAQAQFYNNLFQVPQHIANGGPPQGNVATTSSGSPPKRGREEYEYEDDEAEGSGSWSNTKRWKPDAGAGPSRG